MVVDIVFSESDQSFNCNFGEINNISDGGYEKGYDEGYIDGYLNGFDKGKADGLAQRQYEIWTMTLADGSTVHKEIALI